MKKLRIHYLQHVAYENLGCIENWAIEKGHSITSTRFFENDTLPHSDAFDWLIILGGPMSVNDTDAFDWIEKEKIFICEAIKADKTIIGICLGSQLIASAFGSKVYPNNEKEIGWFPIFKIGEENLLFSDRDFYNVFHWHGETFDLPKEAKLLASSEACYNQAFLIGDKILGLQFHLEVTADSLSKMATFGKNEITDGNYIQSEEIILKNQHHIAENNNKMFALLNHFEAL